MTIPFWAVFGGILIGLSAVLLMLLIGRIAGISGIVWGAIAAKSDDRLWRILFLIGLVFGAFIFHSLSGRPAPDVNENYPLAIMAGLFVGVGVKLGSGCTSGHGVCGIGRLSSRSLVATLVFMSAGIATVAVFNWTTGVGA
ncbi:MAG: YeeE/YedE family protein [Pseudomonadales bacterium]